MDRTGNKRPSKLRQWTNEAMEAAMRAVYDGEMGVNQASREYGVPTTTLTTTMTTTRDLDSQQKKFNYLSDDLKKDTMSTSIKDISTG